MTCAEWEQEIAGESENSELREHLRQCPRCRRFADEIAANRDALRNLPLDPAAFDGVRARILKSIDSRRRRLAWLWAAAAAACIAIAMIPIAWLRFPDPGRPDPVVLSVAPSPPRAAVPDQVRRPEHPRRRTLVAHAHRPPPSAEPLVVKMLTDDPNVVIIWIADSKGDSL